MNSCNDPRQNVTSRSGQGSYRNMPQRPVGCEQRMPERERYEQRMPEREGCNQRMPEREQREQRTTERNQCDREMTEEKQKKWSLGMTYVPWQEWRDIYPLEEGFQCGTIFRELNLPFTGRRMC